MRADDLIESAIRKYSKALQQMGAGVIPSETEIAPACDQIRAELTRQRDEIVKLRAKLAAAEASAAKWCKMWEGECVRAEKRT